MAEQPNAICDICGKPYVVCATCRETISYKPWRTICDTAEHYKIYMIIHQYKNKVISKDEAKEMLGRCDLSDQNTFVPTIKAVVFEILGADRHTNVVTTQDRVPNTAKNKTK